MCYSNKKKGREYSSIYEKTVDQTMELMKKLAIPLKNEYKKRDLEEYNLKVTFIFKGQI